MAAASDSVVIPKTLLIPLEDIMSALTMYRRKQPGLTQDVVGRRAGRYRKWVSEFEREINAPNLKRLLAHAEALNVDVRVVLLPKE
jgi:DNA-binding XRE family transcriptional regulator